jgi:hypothetical protein
MIEVKEYRPNWAINEKFAKDIVFLNVEGKLITGTIGQDLDVEQAKDIKCIEGAIKAVNQFLKSKSHLRIQSTIR